MIVHLVCPIRWLLVVEIVILFSCFSSGFHGTTVLWLPVGDVRMTTPVHLQVLRRPSQASLATRRHL